MQHQIKVTETFQKDIKWLKKKYPHVLQDLSGTLNIIVYHEYGFWFGRGNGGFGGGKGGGNNGGGSSSGGGSSGGW